LAVAGLLLAACSGSGDTADPSAPVTTTDLAGNTVVVTPTQPVTESPDDASATATPTTQDAVETTLPVPPDAGPTTGRPPQQEVLVRVSVEVPGGWSVQDLGEAELAEPVAGEVAPHRWCLVPDYFVPEVDGCAGLVVSVGGDWLPGAAGGRYEPGQTDGWRFGTEPLLCPFDPEAELAEDGTGNVVVSDAEGEPLTSRETDVGGLLMRYETWRVRCSETDEAFSPQMWHVPDLNVLVKDYFGSPDAVAVLESLDGA
jgi:hypothetical protein